MIIDFNKKYSAGKVPIDCFLCNSKLYDLYAAPATHHYTCHGCNDLYVIMSFGTGDYIESIRILSKRIIINGCGIYYMEPSLPERFLMNLDAATIDTAELLPKLDKLLLLV